MKVVSYNIGLVNPEACGINPSSIISDIISLNADVVALYEYERVLCPALDDALCGAFPYRHYFTRSDKGYSSAIFSLFEMTDIEELTICSSDSIGLGFDDDDSYLGTVTKDYEYLQSAEMSDNGRKEAGKRSIIGVTLLSSEGFPIRIFACHLMSNGYNQLLIYEKQSPFFAFGQYVKRFLQSCKGRAIETHYLRKRVDEAFNQGLPVIICGDLNSFYWSRAISNLKSGGSVLKDAWEHSSGNGFFQKLRRFATNFGYGHTLHAHGFMFFRLDYLLHSSQLFVTHYELPHWCHSDHYPLVCNISRHALPKLNDI